MKQSDVEKSERIARTAIHDWEPESISIPMNNDSLDDFQNLGNHLTELIAEALKQEREALLAEVLPVLEFYADQEYWVKAQIKNREFVSIEESDYQSDYCGSLSDDIVIGGKRARALVAKLKGEGE